MRLVARAFPEFRPEPDTAARHFIDAGFGWQSVCLAILGGSTTTLMTRMQHGTRSDMAKIVAAVAGGFLLAGLQLLHSILDSLIIFGALHAGVDISYSDWLGWFGYTVLFNILGGLLLVTALRLLRNKDLIIESRRAAPGDPDAPRETFLAGFDEPQEDSRASRPTLRQRTATPQPRVGGGAAVVSEQVR